MRHKQKSTRRILGNILFSVLKREVLLLMLPLELPSTVVQVVHSIILRALVSMSYLINAAHRSWTVYSLHTIQGDTAHHALNTDMVSGAVAASSRPRESQS